MRAVVQKTRKENNYKLELLIKIVKRVIAAAVVLTIVIAAVVLFSLLLKQDAPDEDKISESARESNLNIKIKNFAFSPKELRIKVGDRVLWTNQDSAPHTVTSESGGELGSETLSLNEEFSHTFDAAGSYDYYCTLHPSMKGKIIAE